MTTHKDDERLDPVLSRSSTLVAAHLHDETDPSSTLTTAERKRPDVARKDEGSRLLGRPDARYNSFAATRAEAVIDVDSTRMPTEDDKTGSIKMGALKGVTIPTCEFMWSVIIFIRFGAIIGQAGLIYALSIMLLAALTVALTVSSISAISTNGMPRGGVLYVLTKSLGSGIGGAIAFIYAVGVAIFISVEMVGSVQGLLQAAKLEIAGSALADQVLVASGCLLFLSTSAYIGARVVHRLALFFLLAIITAYISMFSGLLFAPSAINFGGMVTGLSLNTLRGNLYPEESFQFRDIISLLFPCFVGVYSGVNNAAQLRNPQKAIPWGSLGAIAISVTLYTTLFLLIGSSIDRKLLLSNDTVVPEIALPTPWLTIVGLFLVGQGSALHCCLLCSKVLQTIFAERILPRIRFFRVDHLHQGEPRNAVILVTIFTIPFIFITELESLASIVSMCFLLCYGFTNFACMLLELFRSPHWRPVYKWYHWITSLLGFVLCFGIMLQIQIYAALGLLALAAIGTLLIQIFGSSGIWGHAVHGLLYSLALGHLLAVENEDTEALIKKLDMENDYSETLRLNMSSAQRIRSSNQSVTSTCNDSFIASDPTKRNAIWRPQILAFFGMPNGELQHPRLLSLISQMSNYGGLCILSHILATSAAETQQSDLVRTPTHLQGVPNANAVFVPTEMKVIEDDRIVHRRLKLKLAMRNEGVEGFVKVFAANTVKAGQSMLLQTVGLGELTPNTVLVGWPEKGQWEQNLRSVRELRSIWQMARRVGMSVLIAKGASLFPTNSEEMSGFIDIWWIVSDGPLILLLAFILKRHIVWTNCSLRLFALTGLTENPTTIEGELRRYLALLRIEISSIIVLQIDMGAEGLSMGLSHESVSIPPSSTPHNSGGRADLSEQLEREMELEVGSVEENDWDDTLSSLQSDTGAKISTRNKKKDNRVKHSHTNLKGVNEEVNENNEDDDEDNDDDIQSNTTGNEHNTTGTGIASTRRRNFHQSVRSGQESSDEAASNCSATDTHKTRYSSTSTAIAPRLVGLPSQSMAFTEANMCTSFISSKRKETPFLKQRTAAYIRAEMNKYSKSSDLVILNLPAPNFDVNIFGLNTLRRSGIYMELMEFITQDIPRSILVHSGGRAKDLLSLYAL